MKKARGIVTWVLSVGLAAMFVAVALPKLQGETAETFASFGYAPWFSYVVGIAETAGAVLVLIPVVAFYGAGLLTVVLVGAIYSHVSTGLGNPFAATVFLLVAVALAVLRYPDAAFLGRASK